MLGPIIFEWNHIDIMLVDIEFDGISSARFANLVSRAVGLRGTLMPNRRMYIRAIMPDFDFTGGISTIGGASGQSADHQLSHLPGLQRTRENHTGDDFVS